MGKKRDLVSRYRVDDGKNFRLEGYDPADVPGLNLDKEAAERLLEEGIEELQDLQGKLYAQDRWSLLIILQAMDAAGKDGTIKHVLSGVNPQGVEVSAFKAPSEEELDHDFLWRAARHLPERGRIGIFNRSYYEEVLVVRVHRDLLDRQKLPERFVDRKIWKRRFDDIRAFETEEAASRAHRTAGEELEVHRTGRGRAPVLERLHAGLRRRDPRHQLEACALARSPGRPEVVHAARRRRGDRRSLDRDARALSHPRTFRKAEAPGHPASARQELTSLARPVIPSPSPRHPLAPSPVILSEAKDLLSYV